MHLFGEKNDFAIEVMSEDELTAPSAVWGRLRLWCMGFPLGDIDEPHCGLGALRGLEDISKSTEPLWLDEFGGLTDYELFELLDYKIYGVVCNEIKDDDDRADAEVNLDARKYGKFDFLTNWGEMFDHTGKCFIFKISNNKLKILHRPLGFGLSTISLYCDFDTYRKATTEANAWFQNEAQRLRSFDMFKPAR